VHRDCKLLLDIAYYLGQAFRQSIGINRAQMNDHVADRNVCANQQGSR
jgi:hypothetical protein